GLVRWRALRRRARQVLSELEVDIDPDRPVDSLRIGERQVVEIARAHSDEARCLILDEPTAALSAQEVEHLFAFIHRLRRRVVALYGKVGSGTAEVAEAAFGVRRLNAGEFALDGRPRAFRDPARAIAAGVGLLPADRQREAAFMVRPVAENLSAPSWGRLARLGLFISARTEAIAYRRWHDALTIRSRNDPGQPS